jgi:penicillin-binding protein 1A
MRIAPRKHRDGEVSMAKPRQAKASRPSSTKKSSGNDGQPPRRWGRFLIKWMLILGAWGTLAIGCMFAYFAYDLPDTDKLGELKKKPSVVMRAAEGNYILASYGDLYADYLAYQDLPQNLVNALLATEDRRFFNHFGVDILGLARAAWRNYTHGKVVEGGSTITQQLAKNVFLSPDRTLRRKVQEVMLALWLEHKFTKEEIITIYLNRVYMGAGTFGVDAASRRYFQKPATKLNLSESAMLVGLLKAPSRFSPTNDPERAWGRAKVVLDKMKDAGFLSEESYKAALAHPAKQVNYQEDPSGVRFFTDWVMEELEGYIGNIEDDLDVTTTLVPRMQKVAEASLAAHLAKEDPAIQGALVAMTPNGAVLAMVGGKSYRESQFNRATQALRQPGSSFKVFAYLSAMEAGASPYDIWNDQPINVGKWTPDNYTNNFKGEMSLMDALAQSINSIAVQVSESFGRTRWINLAHRMGIHSTIDNVPSAVLGASVVYPIEMVNAYAVLANDGLSVTPYAITKIKTSKGKTIYEHKEESRERILSPSAVGKANQLLMAVIQSGTGRGAAFGREAAGKTGTSQEYRDAWFVGYTPDIVAGVWMGKDDNKSMNKITGGATPARIWRDFMREAHKGIPPHSLYTRSTDWLDQLLPWNQMNQGAPATPNTPLTTPGGNPLAPQPGMMPTPQPTAPEGEIPVEQPAPLGGEAQPAPGAPQPPQAAGNAPDSASISTPSDLWNAIQGELTKDVEYDYPGHRPAQ